MASAHLGMCRRTHQRFMQHQPHSDGVDGNGDRSEGNGHRSGQGVLTGASMHLPGSVTPGNGSIHPRRPPDVVQDEIDRLIALHEHHLALGVCPEVEAAWLHHRFTQIQPFHDGNGWVARALATMTFLKAGDVPLVIRDDVHREAYVDALVEADAGDLKPLVDLFANVVSADLNDAITFVRSSHGRDIATIAAAAAEAARRHVVHDERSLRMVTDQYRRLAGARLARCGGPVESRVLRGVPRTRSQGSRLDRSGP